MISTFFIAADVVRLFGLRFANLNARDHKGRTALHFAILVSNNEIVDALLHELGCSFEVSQLRHR